MPSITPMIWLISCAAFDGRHGLDRAGHHLAARGGFLMRLGDGFLHLGRPRALSCTPSVTWFIAAVVSSSVAACCSLRFDRSSEAVRISLAPSSTRRTGAHARNGIGQAKGGGVEILAQRLIRGGEGLIDGAIQPVGGQLLQGAAQRFHHALQFGAHGVAFLRLIAKRGERARQPPHAIAIVGKANRAGQIAAGQRFHAFHRADIGAGNRPPADIEVITIPMTATSVIATQIPPFTSPKTARTVPSAATAPNPLCASVSTRNLVRMGASFSNHCNIASSIETLLADALGEDASGSRAFRR
jgi:hypothetical protein